MLNELKFVKGAVSTKDFVPALTHFRIAGGRITGYNGKLSLSAPIALDVDCCPKADTLVKAVEACMGTVQLHVTPAHKLAIRSGKFRAHVELLPETEFPEVAPEGITVPMPDGGLLDALCMLYEFTAEDASRPWAAGVLLDGQSAYATNNVCLVQQWLGYHFPYRVNLPRYAVKEMIRIGEEPVSAQLTENSATFHYEGERWLRTQLNSSEWPDLMRLFLTIPAKKDMAEVPPELFEALETLLPFVDSYSRVYMRDGNLCTALDDNGASVEVAGLPADALFNAKMLRLLNVATHIQLSAYPANVPFYGHALRGFIAGMKG